eukprot:GEMP01044795.1.p1 GENE.GEMP01044795.1~~GEMP01044795.1.p1  ORF type:complete len:249 (+),score=51.75 GEMP01044795.1:82-828(+)
MGFRDVNVFMAKTAENAERFRDMVMHMKRIVEIGTGLDDVERNLLSVAYKSYIGPRRTAWRAVKQLEIKEQKSQNGAEANTHLLQYRQRIEGEMNEICDDCIGVIDKHLLPTASDPESKLQYLKMKGDYNRYQSDFSVNKDEHAKKAEDAHEAYRMASDIALNDLPPTHPARLGLALNFSVFYYEVLNSPERACLLAKSAFDDAVPLMGSLSDEHYKDSATILQLLRDNLTLWTADMLEEGADDRGDN